MNRPKHFQPFVARNHERPFLHLAVQMFFAIGLLVGWNADVLGQCTQAESPVALFERVTLDQVEIPTKTVANSVGLELREEAFEDLRRHKYNEWTLVLPFLNQKSLAIDLESFLPFSDAFMIGRTQEGGKFVEELYRPQLLAYRIVSPGMRGTLVLMEDFVMGTLQWKGQQYDISSIREGAEGKHVVFLLSDAKSPMEFDCAADTEATRRDVMPMGLPQPASSNSVTSCVEVAIDIDFHTYGTFGSDCYPAVEWALALLAGVNTIYTNDLDNLINIQASYIHVWETTDPYNGIVNNAGTMLDTYRLEWLTNPNFVNIQRDIMHLMTRRQNTGTGGIAYLDVVCFPQYAAGFSSYLESQTTYNLNNYSWNLNVVGHELGHNFGSNHTHWCGWPGGPIDNCYDVEGSCSNNPQAQVGTMMSYCHAVAGGSVNLNFHPTVINSALIPTINSDGSCFTTCVNMTTSCDYFGCTDTSACNYDSAAVQDDGTCAYVVDECGICGGDNSSCSGCTNELACNFDPAATLDDGSCFYPIVGSTCDCQYAATFDVNLSAGESANQTIEAFGYVTGFSVVLDFQDLPVDQSWANEMMVGLTAPDGSCLQYGGYNLSLGCPSAGMWPSGWNTSATGVYTAIAVFANPLQGAGDWTITIFNSWDASNGASYETTITFDGLCEGPAPIPGCTDSAACNYDSLATADDGSCEYESCACPADLNGDGQITVADVLIFLGDFGCMESPCIGDTDGDGLTIVGDLLILLASFGEPCPGE